MRLSPLAVAGLVVALVLSLLGIAVFSGAFREISPSKLVADVRLQALTLPSGFSLDNAALAANLVAVLQDRVRKDVGLTVLLGEEATRQLREAALPRLVNTELMTRMIEGLPAFAAMTAAARFRSLAEIEISNRGDSALEDVAITLPRLVLAEGSAEHPLQTKITASGLPAAQLGQLVPGETVSVKAWLGAPLPELLAEESQIRVGARGLDGHARIYGHRGWSGEDFEVLAWGRWVVWSVLAAVALGAAGLLAFAAWQALTGRRAGAA